VPVVAPDQLLAAAARELPGVVALRREIHRAPELGLHLPRTQERVLGDDGLDLVVLPATRSRRSSRISRASTPG
jgi:hippurate hydrolase